MKNVLVVAHPDDEALFFGGLLLSQPGDWTIFCMSTPRADPIRAIEKFGPACKALGAQGLVLRVQEPPADEPFPDDLLGQLDLAPYDRIVTHGREGEYGHVQHKSVHAHIIDKWAHKQLWTRCPPDQVDFNFDLELTPAQMAQKWAALNCYDHVLPYEGVKMSKAAALFKRYCVDGKWNLLSERYRVHQPVAKTINGAADAVLVNS